MINSTDTQLIAKYLAGGALLGGATGLSTSLINHLKTLNHEANRTDDTSGDDDVIYVNVPKKKSGEKLATVDEAPRETSIGATLAMAGFPVAALGSHALVNSLYRRYKKKRLQEKLDDAQQLYIDELSKQAARDPSLGAQNMLLAVPAAALLTALASGVLTNKVLDKQFPTAKPPTSARPKRLVIRDSVDPEGMVKEQSLHDEAYEGLLRTVLELPVNAADSGLSSLVKAAAAGRSEEILRASDVSPDLVFELVKAASSDVPEVKKDLAIGWLVRDPETGPWVKLAAALEYFEAAPIYCAMARELSPEGQDAAIKVAANFCQLSRASRYGQFYKEAASAQVGGRLFEALQDSLEGSDERDPEVVLGNTSSVESTEEQGSPTLQTRGKKARKFADTNKDLIDDIFSPQKAEGQARAV